MSEAAVPVSPVAGGSSLGLISNASDKPGDNPITSILAESSHPTALIFHFGFRTAALFVYMFFSLLLGSSFVTIFVLTTVLLAVDFWTVKNVTGRYLVGRRWWSDAAPDGTAIWTFEAKPAQYKPNPVDSKFFWAGLYGYTTIWMVLGVIALLRFNFSWLLVVAFAILMNGTNLLGYLKCDKEARSSMMNGFVGGFIGGRLHSLVS